MPAGLIFAAASALLWTSVVISIAFFAYAINALHLTLRSRRHQGGASAPLKTRPRVAIHLPIYNEFYVVGRLLRSCAAMAENYGMGSVKIYIMDDSTDETRDLIDRISSDYKERGFDIEVLRREDRRGFKAGALQAALGLTQEKYIAVLDADFVPPRDFLTRTVACLEEDSGLGFVQARWGHIDRDYNLITKSLAVGLDGHFLIEQRGRNGSGYLMNFNGSAGVLRTSAVRQVGGWDPKVLAEDLDLSYRIQLAGYRGTFLNDLEVPGELPPTVNSMKRQQGRWARGSLQTAKKLLGQIRRSDSLTRGQKVEAGVHLTYYLIHPLMVLSFLIVVAAAFIPVDVVRQAVSVPLPSALTLTFAPWLVYSIMILMSTFAVLYYCYEAVRGQRLGVFESVKEVAFLVILGYGVSISNSVQALSGVFSPNTGSFMRTPKYAITGSSQTWRNKKYQIPLNSVTVLELIGVLLASAGIAKATTAGDMGVVPFLLVYLTGYSLVLYLTLRQTLGSAGRADA